MIMVVDTNKTKEKDGTKMTNTEKLTEMLKNYLELDHQIKTLKAQQDALKKEIHSYLDVNKIEEATTTAGTVKRSIYQMTVYNVPEEIKIQYADEKTVIKLNIK